MDHSSPNLNTIFLVLYHAGSEPSNLVPMVVSYSSSGARAVGGRVVENPGNEVGSQLINSKQAY